MLEVRLHGRGGQGSVTSAELFAEAAIGEGKYAQAFPSFGPERRGAPVRAFIRIDDKAIQLRNEIDEPDVVLVLDPTLIRVVNVTEGLKKDGMLQEAFGHRFGKLGEKNYKSCQAAFGETVLEGR